MTIYEEEIKAICPNHDPRLIEAYMRLEHHTLNGLSRAKFRREAKIAARCVDADKAEAEVLAKSFGL